MKRRTKILLGLGTACSILLLGAIWVVRAAIGVAHDAVDSTLDAASSVQKLVQERPSNADKTNSSQKQQPDAGVTTQPSDKAKDTSVFEVGAPSLATTAPNATAKSKAGAQAGSAHEENDFAEIQHALGPLLNDGADDSVDDTVDAGAFIKAIDGDGKDDDWLAVVPGGKSPTLKRLMAGKYAGKEEQALEDAMGDPQAWRLVSFIGGFW